MRVSRSYIFRKVVQLIPAILGIASINFAILHLAPGNIADVLAGEAGAASPEYMQQLTQRFGLDQPLIVQYGKYMANVLQLDLGFSQRFNVPVTDLILQRLPVTLTLLVLTLAIALTVGTLLGIVAARHVDTPVDWAVTLVSLFTYSVPGFWLSLMMIILFSIQLGWLPSSGFSTVGLSNGDWWGHARDVLAHMVMPASALAAFYLAVYARLVRASMLEVYGMEFIRTAEAKGISPTRIAVRHVLRNAMLPVVTMVALSMSSILGGAVVIEQVFALPGIGTLAFDAVFQRDYNLVMGVLFFSSLLVMLVNVALDLLYSALDPRVELR